MNTLSYPAIVIEQDGATEKHYDLFSRLFKDRIVFLGTEINDRVANQVIGQLLFLDSQDPDADIFMYINSPGGVVTAGLGILDVMNDIRAPITTLCLGQAASMGAVLLSAGTQGKRFAMPNARIMIHQVRGGQQGAMPDVRIDYEEMRRLNDRLIEILAENSNRSVEDVAKLSDRDYWMSAQQAVDFGLVDKIKEPR